MRRSITRRGWFAAAAGPLAALSLGRPARGQYLKSRDTAPAPEIRGVTAWINSDPLTLKGLRGKVAVVHFWTHGCSNCINNYPHYKAWRRRYADRKDLVILGIHTPETAGERAIERVRKQAASNGLDFPIAVDNDAANWQAWDNRYWPTVYVVDRRGVVRYGWEGELSYKGAKGEETVRARIDALLQAQA